MKRLVIILVAISFLFACTSNNNKSEKKDVVKKEVAKVEKESKDNEKPKLKMTLNKDQKPGENSDKGTPEGTEPIPGLQSATGEVGQERGTIDDEDEGLKVRRAHTQFNNGITYFKEGELNKAIDAFKLSLEYKPDNSKAFYNLGKIYYELGQKDLAQSYYKDAVGLSPKDSLSMVAVGLIYYEKANYPEALKYYNMTIEIAPKFGLVYFNRGTMLGQNKQYEQSLEDLTNAIKYEPENSEAYINRGLAHFFMDNRDKACEDWKKAESMGNPKGTDAVKIYCMGDSQ